MSSAPINLNKARKARARAEQKVRADRNSVTFGRSKTDKAANNHETARNARKLDGAALEPSPKGSKDGEQKP